ncbi:hypothetical protein SADUNF_Sadunf06G0129400 [Salix dunnii]|uniref:ATPase AAA-type core domain-containing protein n=1 Tax=Salix dunnii TaxID=1413687 RepID=A0A835K4H4_9ROSI|nr:hypothetical protein SADUNF_Sadunf06G0129400 [Salix dunnii]
MNTETMQRNRQGREDLLGFQRLLRGNPYLLHERNPVMAKTPLHVSASYNRAEIIKYLLDWQGAEKVELEPRNMLGGGSKCTSKNGCSEAARLLLAHGAFNEAKENFGTQSVEDRSTVKTLLEYNADCSTEDNKYKNSKTMIARILGRLLHMVGVLPTDKVKEVQRTDLVGELVCHTGPMTRRKIAEAEGGILFVDEAYRLIQSQKEDEKDYGIEALEQIMSVMDSGKVSHVCWLK